MQSLNKFETVSDLRVTFGIVGVWDAQWSKSRFHCSLIFNCKSHIYHIDTYTSIDTHWCFWLIFSQNRTRNSMRTCTTSTVWRLGSPRAFKAKLQAVMVHQAPSACFCGVGLHKDFVDSWNPQELEFSVSVLEDRDGSGNLFVRILLDCLICILGDREGRRENIGKTLPSTCFYMFLRSFTSAVLLLCTMCKCLQLRPWSFMASIRNWEYQMSLRGNLA